MTAVMVERDGVMAAVRALIQDALAGHGGALFVAGEAGLGKTTVLDYAVAAARPGFAVGTGRADVAEAALPFGLIGQALDALAESPGWPGGLGPGSAPVPADFFYAALGALRRAAAAGPLFLALDDAHWADPDSLTLLRLICRRITGMPLAVLVTGRPWPPQALRAGQELAAQQLATVVRLAPLSDKAARSVLSRQVTNALDPADVERATMLCAGNPLLLGHVAEALRSGQGIPEPRSPGGTSWPRLLLLSHVSGLGEPVLRYLQAAAVLGRRFRPEIAGQMAGLTAAGAAAAQEAFTTAGLGRLTTDGWAEFSHELIRQAVYEVAAPARTMLHETAFRLLAARGSSPAEAAGHAVAARLSGDPQAVDVLGRAGREALAVGAVAAARQHLQAAVDLAGPDAEAGLVFDLGRALAAAGDHAAAVATGEKVLTRADLPADMRVAVLVELFQTRFAAGQVAEAEAAIEEALRLAGPGQRDLAAGAMVDHAAQVLVTYGWKRAAPLASRVRHLAADASTRVRAAATALWGMGTYFAGDPAGLDAAEEAARVAAAGPAWWPGGTSWWDTVCQYAAVALSAERFAQAEQLLDGVIEAAQRRCDPMGVAIALMFRARVAWRLGRLDEALEISTRLCAEYTDLVPVTTSMAAAGRALALLDLGRLEEAGEWCDRAAATAGDVAYNATFARLPRGILALRRGDPEEAAAVFSTLWEMADALEVRDPGTVPWAGEAITAYLSCGREADARRLIRQVAAVASALPSRWPKAVVAAGLAALAERDGGPGQALRHYGEALALVRQTPIPVARATLLTDYGAFLHRQGDARQARQVLAEALREAESCGAGWHAERARAAWRRAGGRSGTTPPGQLTPQEAAVARLARAGKTNREIAAQLHLTVNTVQTHLRHVYQKLGIRRRVELIAPPDTGPSLRQPAQEW
jgi:DNA-binding CsgD family transcriptional regulator